ncbi:MAG: helix-turn-helix domain-containing protein [Acidimicrobiia bacterium]
MRVRGEVVSLTPTEWRLLAAFVRHEGQVLSPDQLLEQAWEDPTGVGSDREVRSAAPAAEARVRVPRSGIESVRGFGYRYRSSNS